MNIKGRALHYVFKIGDRAQNMFFFMEILGMKILRHEEFTEGCDAKCNGPYDNRWSKTMIGYGSEDTHFVAELTYNYNVHKYELGNDFLGFYINSNAVVEKVKHHNWPMKVSNSYIEINSPDGYPFYIKNVQSNGNSDPVDKIILASSNLNTSINYWNEVLGLQMFQKSDTDAVFAFDDTQTKLVLRVVGKSIDHKTGFGRIAFSVPEKELQIIDSNIRKVDQKILTPLITLGTPGKASVTVIILADPDDHEICFVGDEGFRKLSQYDPEAESILMKYIKKDAERLHS